MEQIVNIGDASLSCQNLKAVVKKDGLIPYQKQFEVRPSAMIMSYLQQN